MDTNDRTVWCFTSPDAPYPDPSEEELEAGLPVESSITDSEETVIDSRLDGGSLHRAGYLSLS
jgi:hypothetical protein